MVEFITLFLGLVAGPLTIELAVEAPAVEVRVELDGEPLGTITAPPWELEVDLGERLVPRRLVARAFDEHGREIDDATQYLNLPRPPAEVMLMLRRNPDGVVTSVGLSWESRLGRPVRVAASLDGRALDASRPSRIALPPLDPDNLHIFGAEVEFDNGVIASDQIALGGEFLDRANAQLTAVPFEPEADELSRTDVVARSSATGEQLQVAAVDRGSPEAVFVRDGWASRALRQLMGGRSTAGTLSGSRQAWAKRVYDAVPLAEGDSMRVLYPLAFSRTGRRVHYELFVLTAPIDHTSGGLFWHLSTEPRIDQARNVPRLTDAVAIAGSQAASENRPRAVVVLLAADSQDKDSQFEPAAVRDFLQALQVPLFVWYIGKAEKSPPEWGESTSIRGLRDLERALDDLRSAMARQHIVWVEGLHLPEEVVLTEGAP